MVRRPLWAAALCLAAIAAVWLMFDSPPQAAFTVAERSGRELAEGEELNVTGRVYRLETRSGYGRERLEIYLDSISVIRETASNSSQDSRISYSLICETQTDTRPLLGSTVQIKGIFSYFPQAANPGEFDSSQYYRILGIGGRLKNAQIKAFTGTGSVVKEAMYLLKVYFKERLYRYYPGKEASILCAMLLGDKSSLDDETADLYKRSGIIHILSISGLHISLIGMGIYRLLRRCGCPVKVSAAAGGAVLLFYAGMTGMGVSAVRAVGMYLIRMLGECLGRTYDMLTALGVMGAVILVSQPMYLMHSGFLLSFGSICGIGVLLPAMQSITKRKAGKALMAGLSITLFTLPIHLCFYFEVPVYSVFLNLLVLPFTGVIMVTGLAVMLVPGLGFLNVVDRLIFAGYDLLCTWSGALPGHTWTPGCPAMWQVVIYYALILLAVLMKDKWKAGLKILVMAGAVILLGVRFHGGFSAVFLDVGQGDCIFVRTQGGESYLFDGGSSTKSGLGKYTLTPFLKYQGVTRIDAVFVSHPDMDHISGVMELLESGADNGITIKRLVLPAIETDRRREELGKLMEAACLSPQKEEVGISWMSAGVSWKSGTTTFTCLHPPAEFKTEDANAYSECFYVTDGSFSMLLTGDVEGDGEKALTEEMKERGIGDITVLKVAHHGSRNSTSMELLELLNPQLAVISCAADNSYGHPHRELTDRLALTDALMVQTPKSGAIELHVSGGKMRICVYNARRR